MLNCSISPPISTAVNAPRLELWNLCWRLCPRSDSYDFGFAADFLGKPRCRKNLWRRNDESGTEHRLARTISFTCFLLLVFNEDSGANIFAVACSVADTVRSAKRD